MKNLRYTAEFSHDYADGPSGPARSYWTIKRDGRTEIGTLCLHPREGNNPQLSASDVCYWLDSAFKEGRADKAGEIRAAIGL